mmetsp:Transcript_7252/g.22112  ORF Transcript_7252/g.22112 Transcript_7252/m.22112 type:complete len:311 (+) Transcript_7252:29-961(+)
MGKRKRGPSNKEVGAGWLEAGCGEALGIASGGLTASEEAAIDRALGGPVDGDEVPEENVVEEADVDEIGEEEEDDELRSADERAIDEWLGEEDESDMAELVSRLRSAPRKVERKLERRKRQRERAKATAAASRASETHATTAYVRFFGKSPTAAAVEALFAEKSPGAKVRVVSKADSVKTAFVEAPDAATLRDVVACDRAELDGARISVKRALTPNGLRAFVSRKTDPAARRKHEKKKRRKLQRRRETDRHATPEAAKSPRTTGRDAAPLDGAKPQAVSRKRKAVSTPAHAKLAKKRLHRTKRSGAAAET